MIFKGVCTAIVTPFTKSKKVDFDAFKKLIEHQLKGGVSAIVVLGTTGESPTIGFDERKEIIEFCRKNIPQNVKMIVGTGSNNIELAKKYSLQAKNLGADGILVVTPYYNKCTQNGLYEYYKKLTNHVKIPTIVYNVPSRTGVNVLPSTMKKISKLYWVQGLKEANGDINHILNMINTLDKNFAIYSGNDNLNYIFRCYGAKGVISVLSNAYPDLVKKAWDTKSMLLDKKLYKINKHIFLEPNPIPIKYVLKKLGITQNYVRGPLTSLSIKYREVLDADIKELK